MWWWSIIAVLWDRENRADLEFLQLANDLANNVVLNEPHY